MTDKLNELDVMDLDLINEAIKKLKAVPSHGRLLYFKHNTDTDTWDTVYLASNTVSQSGYRSDGEKLDGSAEG